MRRDVINEAMRRMHKALRLIRDDLEQDRSVSSAISALHTQRTSDGRPLRHMQMLD